ncbi:MAG: triose-phosphate isomerase [Bacillota bacterium]
MRKPIIAGNWKMYKTAAQARELVEALEPLVRDNHAVETVVCPPFIDLPAVIEACVGTSIGVGAQNMHWEAEGAYTGEISPGMLKELGCKYVIIGHSERRQYFGEVNSSVNRKVKAAYAAGLAPIVCVGETLEQREAGQTEDTCRDQVENGLQGLSNSLVDDLVIAYEPVWAIGTGKNATAAEAQQVVKYIRQVVAGMFGEQTAQNVRIQYGGSVTPGNIAELMQQPDIDGALVGGASLQAEVFAQIINYQ